MIRNFFFITFRNILRNKIFSLINVFGLAIGFAACIIIYLYVDQETSYDQYHEKGGRIYRLLGYSPRTGGYDAIKPGVLWDHIYGKLPGIEQMTRIFRRTGTMEAEGKKFNEDNLKFSDPGVFEMFSWDFLSGDPENALTDKHSIVLTKHMADKYFPDADPVGKIITLDNQVDFVVSGVISDLPDNSHFTFDFLGHSSIFEDLNPSALEHWGNASVFYYFLLEPGASAQMIEKSIDEIIRQSHPSGDKITLEARLQPLYDIHLYSSHIKWDINPHGDIKVVYGFSLVAFLILLIACFNFTNLTTANAGARARETGIRKVVGASRHRLIYRYMFETLLYSSVALLIGVLIVEWLLPLFNDISGRQLTLSFVKSPELLWIFPAMILFVSVVAGSYPAFVLSGFKPVTILKGSVMSGGTKNNGFQLRLRQVLIVLQFTVSIGLIIGSILINRQMKYVGEKSLGFDREAVLVIENPWDSLMFSRYKRLGAKLMQNTMITGFGASHNIPGSDLNNYTGAFREVSQPKEEGHSVAIVSVDTGFFKTMGAGILSGVDFSDPGPSNVEDLCIINETLLGQLNVEDPLGMDMTGFYSEGTRRIVGVVNDIHYMSLHEKVKPVVYIVSPHQYPPFANNLVVKASEGNAAGAMKMVEELWNETAPNWPLQAHFLDHQLEQHYRADKQVMQVMNIFTLLAIVISLMGLFGLTLFVMRSRTREIGIRQVHGATIRQLMQMFSGEFTILLLFSNIIAWPVAFWFIQNWLDGFAFRIHIGVVPFVVAALVTMLLAMLMVAWHLIRTLATNPVNALRHE